MGAPHDATRRPVTMVQFTAHASQAFIASLLLVTGAAHLGGLSKLARLVRQHRLIPDRASMPAALLVTAGELAVAAAAVVGIVADDWRVRLAASAGAVLASTCLLVYMRALVRSGHRGSCGCTPLDGPLTIASFAPAAGLGVAGLLGIAASTAGDLQPLPAPSWAALGVVWGATLACLVVVLPATVPRGAGPTSPTGGRRRDDRLGVAR